MSLRAQLLLRELTSRAIPFGREDSVKLSRRGVLADRILLGTPSAGLGCGELLQIGEALGMPACYRVLLSEQYANANMVLLGLEDRADGGVFKVYLEFWDRLNNHVNTTGSTTPALLNIGVKWDTQTGSHCRTDYVCHPLLSVGGILGRLERLYEGRAAQPSREFSARVIHRAAARKPNEAFVYLEVSEGGSPRRSFDLNLYPAELTVADIYPLATGLGRAYGIDPGDLDRLWESVGNRLLGHISGGCDRHGSDFATVYYEAQELGRFALGSALREEQS